MPLSYPTATFGVPLGATCHLFYGVCIVERVWNIKFLDIIYRDVQFLLYTDSKTSLHMSKQMIHRSKSHIHTSQNKLQVLEEVPLLNSTTCIPVCFLLIFEKYIENLDKCQLSININPKLVKFVQGTCLLTSYDL